MKPYGYDGFCSDGYTPFLKKWANHSQNQQKRIGKTIKKKQNRRKRKQDKRNLSRPQDTGE